jgi:Na+-transporting methylmalonyl-CoA/oxaloacetate decarboxylase gamma subunit
MSEGDETEGVDYDASFPPRKNLSFLSIFCLLLMVAAFMWMVSFLVTKSHDAEVRMNTPEVWRARAEYEKVLAEAVITRVKCVSEATENLAKVEPFIPSTRMDYQKWMENLSDQVRYACKM